LLRNDYRPPYDWYIPYNHYYFFCSDLTKKKLADECMNRSRYLKEYLDFFNSTSMSVHYSGHIHTY
jgi:hypothetical protein